MKALQQFTTFSILFLAFTLTASAQQFRATANVDNPPYGLVAQVWNASPSTVYIDHIDVSAALEATQPAGPGGILEFGIGFSHLEESQCKPLTMLVLDPVNGPANSTDTNLRASQQPCTPNGLAYGAPTGPNSWNYTPTNSFNLGFCYGLDCTLDFPGGLAILPNHGVTVYTSYYKEPNAFGWNGYAGVNFRGRK